MALTNKSLLLYGLEITSTNSSLDFKSASLGPTLQATLRRGSYSLTGLMTEIARAMNEQDPSHTFTVTAARTFNSNIENRITIATSGTFLSLLFGTGPRTASSVASTIGFANSDRTGSTSYQGVSTSGTALLTTRNGYTYLGPEMMRNVFGASNISASGLKETVVWSVQKFIQVEFKYEPESKVLTEWVNFMTWAIQQKPYEFTPVYTAPTTFYEVTLESTGSDGKGLGYKMDEMLPDFPFEYKTGLIKMRVKE